MERNTLYKKTEARSTDTFDERLRSKDRYTNISKSETFRTRPFQESTFIDNVEPSMKLGKDFCTSNTECRNNSEFTYLNQRGVLSPYFKMDTNKAYMSTKADARLYNSAQNQYTELDSRPIQVVYDLINDNILGNPALNNYGRNYTDYSSVNAGQIQYYVDKQFTEPFYTPVYGTKAKSTGTMYKDPMDSIKPHFDREYPEFGKYSDGTCLSFIDDTTKFRDDIISRQQRAHNQNKFSLVYGKI